MRTAKDATRMVMTPRRNTRSRGRGKEDKGGGDVCVGVGLEYLVFLILGNFAAR